MNTEIIVNGRLVGQDEIMIDSLDINGRNTTNDFIYTDFINGNNVTIEVGGVCSPEALYHIRMDTMNTDENIDIRLRL